MFCRVVKEATCQLLEAHMYAALSCFLMIIDVIKVNCRPGKPSLQCEAEASLYFLKEEITLGEGECIKDCCDRCNICHEGKES